jgi:transposase
MTKTQSQTENTAIKKEEEDGKTALLLNGISNTRRSSRIAKRTPPIINNRRLPTQQVKMEEDTDIKPLLQSGSKSSKLPKGQTVSQKQISQLIHYIVNDKMSVAAAARKAKVSQYEGYRYYNVYKNDPEKKIPVPRNQHTQPRKYYTQEQTGNLIKYITQDKMTLKEASAKADMVYKSGRRYYNRYLKDPNHNIPIPQLQQSYTQEQREVFLGYIINDKMSIKAASKKAEMNHGTARDYYLNYFKFQNPDIARPNHIATCKHYTQEQIKELISYIVDDKMTIKAASKKASMSVNTASKYYCRYLKDRTLDPRPSNIYTQEQKSEFIGYIVHDKMTLTAASEKVNMTEFTGRKYYRQYLKEHSLDMPMPIRYTQEQKGELIRYIIDDKMSIPKASKKANVSLTTGYKYYRQYLKDRHVDYPIQKVITQQQKSKLIGYIVHDKMSIPAASKKANMSFTTGYKYYRQHQNNQKCDAST